MNESLLKILFVDNDIQISEFGKPSTAPASTWPWNRLPRRFVSPC